MFCEIFCFFSGFLLHVISQKFPILLYFITDWGDNDDRQHSKNTNLTTLTTSSDLQTVSLEARSPSTEHIGELCPQKDACEIPVPNQGDMHLKTVKF